MHQGFEFLQGSPRNCTQEFRTKLAPGSLDIPQVRVATLEAHVVFGSGVGSQALRRMPSPKDTHHLTNPENKKAVGRNV